MTHTPGPWSVGFDANSWEDGGVSVLADGRGMVCSITNKLNGLYQDSAGDGSLLTPRTIGHQEANARLIAAAPEMLAALRAARDDLSDLLEVAHLTDEGEADTTEVLDQVIAAIAKAEGRE